MKKAGVVAKKVSLKKGGGGDLVKKKGAASKKASGTKKKVGTSKKGNSVKVYVRVRPLNSKESKAKEKSCVVKDKGEQENKQLTLCKPGVNPSSGSQTFAFDKCYTDCSQADVFEEIGSRILDNAFAGFNSSLFCSVRQVLVRVSP